MRTSPIMQLFYFLVGFAIAAVLVLLLGCQPNTDSGLVRESMPPLPEPRMCCMALTPSCEACKVNVSVEYWLRETCGNENATNAEYAGWDEEKNEAIWLCQITIVN